MKHFDEIMSDALFATFKAVFVSLAAVAALGFWPMVFMGIGKLAEDHHQARQDERCTRAIMRAVHLSPEVAQRSLYHACKKDTTQ